MVKIGSYKKAFALLALSLIVSAGSNVTEAKTCKTFGPFTISSPAFQNGDPIPTIYTADGSNISPPLLWKNVPDGCKKLVLICDDPDAPGGTWVHWVVYDILKQSEGLTESYSKQMAGIPEGPIKQAALNDGTRQGLNSWGKIGWDGPSPPPGSVHHYYFKLYAVDTRLHLKGRATKEEVLCKMRGHVLAEAQLMGTYQR